MSGPYLNLSYLTLIIHHNLLKNPLYCCLTVWGWFPREHFMTMQPQKCCGEHQEEGNGQDGSEEALKSERAACICYIQRQGVRQGSQVTIMSLLKRYNTVVHLHYGRHFVHILLFFLVGDLWENRVIKYRWSLLVLHCIVLFTVYLYWNGKDKEKQNNTPALSGSQHFFDPASQCMNSTLSGSATASCKQYEIIAIIM